MKWLLLIALTISMHASDLLISGLSYHSVSHGKDGRKINPYNYGIGYRWIDNYDWYTVSVTGLIAKDSFDHTMTSLTYGLNYVTTYRDIGISIGLESGGIYKKILKRSQTDGIWTPYKYRYKILPIVYTVPTLSITKKDWTLHIVHVPKIDNGVTYVTSSTLLLIGYKI